MTAAEKTEPNVPAPAPALADPALYFNRELSWLAFNRRVPGVSDNIRVVSILGRFLEHERVFVFGAPGDEQMFVSSADWMPRNLTRRVEVLCPVDAAAARAQLRSEVVEPALDDNAHAYDMHQDGTYARRRPRPGEAARGAQAIVLAATVGLVTPEVEVVEVAEPAAPIVLGEAPAVARGGKDGRERAARGQPAPTAESA
jgi:polyphosphate kinase